jgi:hypothetical protein
LKYLNSIDGQVQQIRECFNVLRQEGVELENGQLKELQFLNRAVHRADTTQTMIDLSNNICDIQLDREFFEFDSAEALKTMQSVLFIKYKEIFPNVPDKDLWLRMSDKVTSIFNAKKTRQPMGSLSTNRLQNLRVNTNVDGRCEYQIREDSPSENYNSEKLPYSKAGKLFMKSNKEAINIASVNPYNEISGHQAWQMALRKNATPPGQVSAKTERDSVTVSAISNSNTAINTPAVTVVNKSPIPLRKKANTEIQAIPVGRKREEFSSRGAYNKTPLKERPRKALTRNETSRNQTARDNSATYTGNSSARLGDLRKNLHSRDRSKSGLGVLKKKSSIGPTIDHWERNTAPTNSDQIDFSKTLSGVIREPQNDVQSDLGLDFNDTPTEP